MMRGLTLLLCVAMIVTTGTLTASAQPPNRPAKLTPDQFHALRQLEAQPQHAAVLQLRASYSSDRQMRLDADRMANDVSTAVWQAGFPGIIVMMLLIAAPL